MVSIERNMKLMRAAIIEQTAAMQTLTDRIAMLEEQVKLLLPKDVDSCMELINTPPGYSNKQLAEDIAHAKFD